jgi:hypothetical protein
MSDAVKLVECPRDAWQGLKGMIPADLKANYLKALISAGFKHIDAVSFVSPKAVPQMSDSEEVLKELDPPDDVEIIGQSGFRIRFPRHSCARIRISRLKMRSRNSRRFRKKPTVPDLKWWFISPWPSEILTEICGVPTRFSMQ